MTQMIFYPRLSNKDFGEVRFGGPGLANCMFIAAKAFILSETNKGLYIEPTWRKFSIGPWVRGEKDKRIYSNLFHNRGIDGLKKLGYLLLSHFHSRKVVIIDSLGNYFQDINNYYELVHNYFNSIVRQETIHLVKSEILNDYIAVHVRLGDYLPHLRIPIKWYVDVINHLRLHNPNLKFALFSDGTDEELKDLLSIKGVEKKFYGNAFADMWAISKCKCLIASDSTFSAWGAFLGQKPILFNRRHFPPVYNGDILEVVEPDADKIPNSFINLIK